MLHRVVAAGLKDVIETYQIALDIGIGVSDRISHASLGSEIHYNIKVVFGEKFFYQNFVGQIPLYELIIDN